VAAAKSHGESVGGFINDGGENNSAAKLWRSKIGSASAKKKSGGIEAAWQYLNIGGKYQWLMKMARK
jgi:hypothetical protein